MLKNKKKICDDLKDINNMGFCFFFKAGSDDIAYARGLLKVQISENIKCELEGESLFGIAKGLDNERSRFVNIQKSLFWSTSKKKVIKRYYPGGLGKIKIPQVSLDNFFGKGTTRVLQMVNKEKGVISTLGKAWAWGGSTLVSIMAVSFWLAGIVVLNPEARQIVTTQDTYIRIAEKICGVTGNILINTPRISMAFLSSLMCFANQVYVAAKVCNRPLVKDSLGFLLKPFKTFGLDVHGKLVDYAERKIIEKYGEWKYSFIKPVLNLVLRGWFSKGAKGFDFWEDVIRCIVENERVVKELLLEYERYINYRNGVLRSSKIIHTCNNSKEYDEFIKSYEDFDISNDDYF